MIFTYTYKQPITPTPLLFQMAKESGEIYSKALNLNKEHKTFKEITKICYQDYQENGKVLHSQSAQASYEAFIESLKAYFKALKAFKKNPKKVSGEPKPPRKYKFLFKIEFKKTAIRFKDNFLLLSVKKPNEPIKIPWSKFLPVPHYVIINYNKFEGWNVNFILQKEITEEKLDHNKALSIDLGVKRIATAFNSTNNEIKTYSGKEVMSLIRLRNVVDGRIQSKKSYYENGSRKHKKFQRAKRKIIRRIKNKQKDILHKYSRIIVNDCIKNKISKIIIGDNSGTHIDTNKGKQNQKIQQNPEQVLAKYIEYKMKSVGGQTNFVPEPYTSRTCPKCQHINGHKTKGRIFVCDACGFKFDRDGVGSLNIFKENVSFDYDKWLDVVGNLTFPIGIKYSKDIKVPRLSPSNRIIDLKESISQLVLVAL